MILCILDLSWFTDISLVDKLSLNALSLLVLHFYFHIFVTYFWGFLFQNRVWGMKFYLACEMPFQTNVQKEEVTPGWPHPGEVAQYGLGGIQCQGSVQLLPFMSFEFNFFIPASLSANSV